MPRIRGLLYLGMVYLLERTLAKKMIDSDDELLLGRHYTASILVTVQGVAKQVRGSSVNQMRRNLKLSKTVAREVTLGYEPVLTMFISG